MHIPPKASASNGNSQHVHANRTKKVLNVPLVLGTLLAAAVLGPAAYAWRSYQVGRTADAFLERADQLEKEENWRDAAAYLHRYLQLRSDDPDIADIWIRIAETFDKSAQTWPGKRQAVAYYYRALSAVASREEKRPGDEDNERSLRFRLAALQLELRWFASAEKEAQKLVDADPADPEGQRLRALALYRQAQLAPVLTLPKDVDSVATAFKKALKLQPDDVQLSSLLATIYREQPKLLSKDQRDLPAEERAKLADDVMNDLVAANPKRAEALLARYRYRMQCQLPGARGDLDAALEIAPDDVAVLVTAGAHFRAEAIRIRADQAPSNKARENYQKACAYYERAVDVAPSTEAAYVGLGEIYTRLSQPEKAVEVWQQGLKRCGQESLSLNSHLAEVLINQGRLDQAEKHLDALDRVLRRLAATSTPSTRIPVERSCALLRGSWLVAKRKYLEAIPVLTRVTAGQTSLPSERQAAFAGGMLLGYTYGQLGLWDKAASAYEEAARLQIKAVAPQLMAAAAWANAGIPQRAVEHYEKALAIEDNPQTWLALARARLQRQVALPTEQRDWEPFDKALAEAQKARPEQPLAEPWRLKLLEVDYLLVRPAEAGGLKESKGKARELLRQAEHEYPQSKDLLQRLVLGYERLGFPDDADRALSSFTQLAEASAAPYLLRSRLYSIRKRYEEARESLRTGLKELDEKENAAARLALQFGLVQVSLDQGDPEGARQQLRRLQKRDPSNVGIVRRLAELALDAGSLDDVENWEQKLRELEGPDGSYWRLYKTRRLLMQTKTTTEPRFVEAERLQSDLELQRPAWPHAHLLRALIRERQGRHDEAIQAYQRAIRFGERRLSVYQALTFLFYRTGRLQEADQYLAHLKDRSPTLVSSSTVLSPVAISVAANLGQMDRAVEAARQGVKSRAKDPMARIWLGNVLLLSDKTDEKQRQDQLKEAEAAFQQAVELSPGDVRTHSALFGFYLRSDQPDRARETLQKTVQKVDLSDAQRFLVLAQGYEQLGDRDQAEKCYREATRKAPDNAAMRMRLARLLLQSDPAEAEEVLRGILKSESNSPAAQEARRTLALMLARRGGEEAWKELEHLLQPMAGESSLDRRLQAVLRAQRGGTANLGRARQLMEKVLADVKQSNPGDRLLLARLYEAEGRPQAARDQLLKLVTRTNPNPAHVALFVDFLIRQALRKDRHLRDAELKDAAVWLDKLEELAPRQLGTAQLRARWLYAHGRTDEIEPMVEKLADELQKQVGEDQAAQAQIALGVGNLYSAVDQHEAAERWYRRLAEFKPQVYQPLVMSLARQGRMQDAIQVCLDASQSDSSPKPAIALTSALTSSRATDDDFAIADPIIAKTLERHSDNADLLFSVANLRFVQGRPDGAERLYRRVLELRPKDVLTLNNLASVLGEQPRPIKRKEALNCIEEAIQIAGPKAAFLDTMGMILVHGGQLQQAIQGLEEACSNPDADPRFPFHLAVAYDRNGQDDKAREALDRARQGGLEEQILTPKDRELLEKLQKKYPQ